MWSNGVGPSSLILQICFLLSQHIQEAQLYFLKKKSKEEEQHGWQSHDPIPEDMNGVELHVVPSIPELLNGRILLLTHGSWRTCPEVAGGSIQQALHK